MIMSRRQFVGGTAVGLLTVSGLPQARAASSNGERVAPLVVSTWPFGKPSNEEALKVLANGGSVLDAVEQGIRLAESTSPGQSVGLGGKPNAAGVVQLDACIMFGPGHKGGSVGALEGIRHPISVARRIMEKTPHVMLVGEGARQFAISEGFDRDESVTGKAPLPKTAKKEKNHDTISLLALA